MLVLIGVIILFTVTKSPILCAIIYAIATFLVELFVGNDVTHALVLALINSGYLFGLFWILKKMENAAWFIWWSILIVGLLLPAWLSVSLRTLF